jgi:hypothetical protein
MWPPFAENMGKEVLEYWKDWADFAGLIFAFIVGVGVVGEFAAHFAYRYFSRQLEPIILAEEESLRKQIAEAEARAAEANARAAEANEKMEQEKLARAKIEQRIAPRVLPIPARERIIKTLKKFSGTTFDMAIQQEADSEALALVIDDILKSAGWNEIDWKGGMLVFTRPGRNVAGIIVLNDVILQMDKSRVSEFMPAATALASALVKEGITARAEGGSGTHAENTHALHVLVGQKTK